MYKDDPPLDKESPPRGSAHAVDTARDRVPGGWLARPQSQPASLEHGHGRGHSVIEFEDLRRRRTPPMP